MATNTSIEWADKTWSPIIGCDRVSPGCDSCYAISQARIRSHNPNPKISNAFAGTVDVIDGRVDWTGTVNQITSRLTEPLTWKKPAKVFVNSLSDLFHKAVPDEFIAKVFAVMAATPQHTYQILTKRHARMRALLRSDDFRLLTKDEYTGLHLDRLIPGQPLVINIWPLRNVWLGVSVENQDWANIRIPALLETPAAVRFLSCEPLLGPIDLKKAVWTMGSERGHGLTASFVHAGDCCHKFHGIDWVIAGGESGPAARPMHPDWPRSLRNQCAAADIPYLFKQWGTWGVEAPLDDQGRLLNTRRGLGIAVADDGTVYQPGELSYPNGPRYGEAVRAGHDRAHLTAMYRLGKKAAGRELDGREHNDFPEVTAK